MNSVQQHSICVIILQEYLVMNANRLWYSCDRSCSCLIFFISLFIFMKVNINNVSAHVCVHMM